METFSYDAWDRLLAEVVADDGKVDYERLADRRALLKEFVAELGAASPESRPDLFPGEEDGLAYWINAYNAFTLDAIVDEYPIRSVWKTRDGRFFQRRRHVAGNAALSLDDIEHEILRSEFAEPRIHFAINCGANGCPAVRPSAYRGEGLRDTLREAAGAFLANRWNCRVDHEAERLHISRIFRMYAEDFARGAGTREEYRSGVLRFVAEHAGLDLDGNLKFYGGEPTLHTREIVAAMRYVRERGFTGLITVFSNGIQAEKLISILESDPKSEAVLNYSIYHGRDADPMPPYARERLEDWARANPNRISQGYKVLFHAGAGADQAFARDRESEYHGMGNRCVRCFPVLTTKGKFHACPFAAEIDSPHFDLGAVGSDSGTVFENYRSFLRWVDDELDPAAAAKGVSSCEMCHKHLGELPVPEFTTGESSA